MSSGGSYRTAGGEGRAELREKGSRFLAAVAPAEDEEAARRVIEEIAAGHRDATHVCWAWRLGSPPRERSSDAGEPAGTAAIPMLQVLRGAELSDAVAVVVRWFGGTKLGKGGLARAYAGAVRAALDGVAVTLRSPTEELRLELPYDRLGALKRLVHPPEVELVEESYGEQVAVTLKVFASRLADLRAALAELGIEEPRRTTL